MRPFRGDPKESHQLVERASDVPFEAQPPQNQTYFKIILWLNKDLKSYILRYMRYKIYFNSYDTVFEIKSLHSYDGKH